MIPAGRRSRAGVAAGLDARPWAILLGLAIVAGLAGLDAQWGPDKIIAATVVIAPFLTALVGTPLDTAIVGIAAVAVCALSGSWNHNFGADDYIVRVLVVATGAVFAVVGARGRERLAADRQRFRQLAGVAAITETSASIGETVERLNELLVPALADVAVIDVLRDGLPERLAVAAHGPRRAELGAALRRADPGVPEEPAEPAWPDTIGVRSSP